MPVSDIGDPRLQALFGATDPREAGIRPTVRLPRKGLPPAALAAAAVIFGVLLFIVLNDRRTSQSEPTVKIRPDSAASAWAVPPPLYVPPVLPAVPQSAPPALRQPIVVQPSIAPAPASARQAPVQTTYVPQPLMQIAPPPPAPQPRVSSGAPLVVDTGGAPVAAGGAGPTGSTPIASGTGVTRVRASTLANRSMTIAQGTLLQAVLETAFDSTRPGFARAIVSRNVRSFDGTAVLIPRGSKLVGEYRSEVAQGQKRAVIVWTRLMRPDGMTISLDSPAVDTLGRGGVPATVNTHFFARVGDALLQSTIGLGGALAQRSVTGPVVVLPGSATAAASQVAPANSYVPTLTVPAGKSISVFVAHDLDFSAARGVR